MKYITNILSSILAMILIMTLSPAQSMEMTAGYELPESGVMIHFTSQAERSHTPQHATGVSEETPKAYPTADTHSRIELPESGQMILFSNGDEPTDPATGSNRYIAKPYAETPAPWAGASYHRRHTFEMPESGNQIVFYDASTDSPEYASHDTLADQ